MGGIQPPGGAGHPVGPVGGAGELDGDRPGTVDLQGVENGIESHSLVGAGNEGADKLFHYRGALHRATLAVLDLEEILARREVKQAVSVADRKAGYAGEEVAVGVEGVVVEHVGWGTPDDGDAQPAVVGVGAAFPDAPAVKTQSRRAGQGVASLLHAALLVDSLIDVGAGAQVGKNQVV